MKSLMKNSLLNILASIVTLFITSSCIEPPLHLPAQEVMVEMQVALSDLEIVWNVKTDWKSEWYYGWDKKDQELWGDIEYPTPTNYEVRRYFLGETPHVAHKNVDGFTIHANSFRRAYEFGYYDLLIWSNIDSEDETQAVTVDESNIDEVHASTSKTRGMTRASRTEPVSEGITLLEGIPTEDIQEVVGLFNQPEIFYSTYPRDVFISRDYNDYDYFNEEEGVWVKQINCTLNPLVYMYLVQVIIKNNNGKIKGCSGENAVSNISAGTSVNFGQTWNLPCMTYFNSRMKYDLDYKGEKVDIIGGKFTTYGLCDMPSYISNQNSQYAGSRNDLSNYVYVEFVYNNGVTRTLKCDVTDQMRKKSHGGVLTIVLDADKLPNPPSPETGTGSVFVPTVDDYDEVEFDIDM